MKFGQVYEIFGLSKKEKIEKGADKKVIDFVVDYMKRSFKNKMKRSERRGEQERLAKYKETYGEGDKFNMDHFHDLEVFFDNDIKDPKWKNIAYILKNIDLNDEYARGQKLDKKIEKEILKDKAFQIKNWKIHYVISDIGENFWKGKEIGGVDITYKYTGK